MKELNIFKHLSMLDIIKIGNFKKQYPDLSESELYDLLQELYPDLYEKIEKLKNEVKNGK